MIYLFRTRTANIATIPIKDEVCNYCNTQGSLVAHIYRRHFHLFWVPLFPLGKRGFTECQHCKNVLKPKEMPSNLRNAFMLIKKNSKGPIWQFTGLLFIAAFIVFMMVITIINRSYILFLESTINK